MTNYLLVIWFPVIDYYQHFIEAEYVFGAHKVVAEHDEVHLSIYFLQAF